ncbi:hypothetical protein PHLGIDRAFT_24698 [Phlebiopsis gigantea 11061_1 CR5-6]|uniref:Septin-type G domain-containing protein n=1 Tax=Phlebiopsis gigantea (strain 11061_1 CR5-6) TaxID=745531 RepID=A0A0C3PJA7_PHLG1|nr:hypothetical protein PHLGIDRAFT_24698 [Phlebiopsis gigantea 11061_1 CR5-6]
MFSFRRKGSKKQAQGGPPYIRTSPSLPELSTQGVPWPEDLIDASEIPKIAVPPVPQHGYTKPAGGPISALYAAPPPSAFDNRRASTHARMRPSQRRKEPTTFNVMVVGARGLGKTSLLRLLLETAEVSPTAPPEQRIALEHFLRGAPRPTREIHTTRIEICESRFDRLLLSVTDTPGLDFGDELTLERQVSSIVKHMESQFAETLSEESKVVRKSKGDQHVHLCIYAIDPSRITPSAQRGSHLSEQTSVRSQSTISSSQAPVHSPVTSDSFSNGSDDDQADNLAMSRADIAVMRRLVKKTNILPVVARADCLTDESLAAIKKVVKRDIEAAGLDLGVFNPVVPADRAETPRAPRANGKDNAQEGETHDDGATQRSQDEETSEPEEERGSRPVIKLRASRSRFRMPWTRSRSRSRLEEAEPGDEPTSVDAMDSESVASVRFSARRVAQAQLGELIPFAFIAPEPSRRRLPPSLVPPLPEDHQSIHTDAGAAPSEDMHTSESAVSSPVSVSKHAPLLAGPPADLRGVFVRKYRWGTIDVLSPEHCDFAALRTAVLSTHMKMLKIRTKEVLYERYRTEKLLSRRATKSISADQQRQMFDELGF